MMNAVITIFLDKLSMLLKLCAYMYMYLVEGVLLCPWGGGEVLLWPLGGGGGATMAFGRGGVCYCSSSPIPRGVCSHHYPLSPPPSPASPSASG